MSFGDFIQGHSNVADGASLAIKPAGDLKYRIKGVYFETNGVAADVRIIRTDGVNEIEVESSGAGYTGYVGMDWIASATEWWLIKNESGITLTFSYDAVTVEE